MRYLSVLGVILLIHTFSTAQTYEIGLLAGGSNYVGDVGDDRVINPNAPVGGLLLKWNRSNRHAFRFTASKATLTGNDVNSTESRRQSRGYQFTTSLTEFSLGIEYTFWEFNQYDGQTPGTPYLYSGIAYSLYDEHRLDTRSNQLIKDGASNATFVIPINLGYKKAFRGPITVGVEASLRYTFTDHLDGSNPGDSAAQGEIFGNINNNDWYLFFVGTLTYTFGQKPCFCAF